MPAVHSAYAQPFALSATYAAARGDGPKGEDDFVPDLNVRLLCPECQVDPPNINEEFASGDLVCGDCGLVLGDRIVDTRSECECLRFERKATLCVAK